MAFSVLPFFFFNLDEYQFSVHNINFLITGMQNNVSLDIKKCLVRKLSKMFPKLISSIINSLILNIINSCGHEDSCIIPDVC